MFEELPKYKTVWNALKDAKDIDSVCDIFMLKYEKPGTTTEAAKEARRKYAARYFDQFEMEEYVPGTEPVAPAKPKTKYVYTTTDRVLIRSGNGKDYPAIDRIGTKGSISLWVATSENGWYAIRMKDRVGWVSSEFAEIKEV